MRQVRMVMLSLLMVALCTGLGQAQQSATAGNTAVPPLIQFSNVATDEHGDTLSGVRASGARKPCSGRRGAANWNRAVIIGQFRDCESRHGVSSREAVRALEES